MPSSLNCQIKLFQDRHSSLRVIMVSSFHNAWKEPELNPLALHLLTAPSEDPSLATHHNYAFLPQMRQNCNQESEKPSTARSTWRSTPPTSTCPCLAALTPSGVALKNFAKYFLQNLKRGNMLEKVRKLQTNKVAKSQILQDIKKPNHGNWESRLNAMVGASVTTGKKHQSVTTGTPPTGH